MGPPWGLSGDTWLIIAATSVPFLALEVWFFFRFGAWQRRRDGAGGGEGGAP